MMTLRQQLSRPWILLDIALLALIPTIAWGQNPTLETIDVEGQPLAANVTRLLQALDFLGSPLPKEQGGSAKRTTANGAKTR